MPALDKGWGLRFSLTDGVVIVVAAVVTWIANEHIGSLAVLVPFLVGHFFLFCNVFRVRRSLELAWGASFVIHICGWLLPSDGDPRKLLVWWVFCAIQLPITALVVGIEMRSSRYHGVFARRINPAFCPRDEGS